MIEPDAVLVASKAGHDTGFVWHSFLSVYEEHYSIRGCSILSKLVDSCRSTELPDLAFEQEGFDLVEPVVSAQEV